MEISLPGSTDRERQSPPSSSGPSRLFGHVVAWCETMVGRVRGESGTGHPLLIRTTAHLTVVVLALTAIGLSDLTIPAPQIAAGGSGDGDTLSVASLTAEDPTPSPNPVATNSQPSRSNTSDTIARQPVLHTTFPDRPRAEVITYTVREGDNISTIAYQHGLSPQTIVWSNSEAIQDAPWLIRPGLQLFILPVDGVYHTVSAGETVGSIAAEYDVEPSALYNQWNDVVEGDSLYEGQLLVVPQGTGWEITWTPPEPEPTQTYAYRVSSASGVAAPAARNYFILPTGSRRVSGWYFRDRRNPGHIGLDYACRLGDPLYAADSGVVTISGWSGGYGILVEIDHRNGYVTRYAHLSRLHVSAGQAVSQGAVIGLCGSTGWSTGPHLHFEIRRHGVPQDPLRYQP